ncbi:MAG: nucleoside-diphosphate kinase [Ignavibacteriales bacterium]|nr:nucleoside-diphosphate kinase [Ignavibacteriales bacterium]
MSKNNHTLAILKPDCYRKKLIGKVIDKIIEAGFKIQKMKMVHLTKDEAENFYEVHKNKDFYPELIKFMTSGPAFPMILEKDNAIETFRELIGSTDPNEADEGTIRKLYADNVRQNIVHGSDTETNAKREIKFFFDSEID